MYKNIFSSSCRYKHHSTDDCQIHSEYIQLLWWIEVFGEHYLLVIIHIPHQLSSISDTCVGDCVSRACLIRWWLQYNCCWNSVSMSRTITHTHTYIPVASKQLDSNEVKSTKKRIFVILSLHDKFHWYCMQLHKYISRLKIVIPIAYIYMTCVL